MKPIDYVIGAITGALLLGSLAALVVVASGPAASGGPDQYVPSIWLAAICMGTFGMAPGIGVTLWQAWRIEDGR